MVGAAYLREVEEMAAGDSTCQTAPDIGFYVVAYLYAAIAKPIPVYKRKFLPKALFAVLIR